MRITTWNVNGIRAAYQKGLGEWVLSANPDVLCLQEIKARPEQLDEEKRTFDGYEAVWNPAERLGYSGVASFFRKPPLEIGMGLGVPEFDREGRVIWMRYPGFRLYNIYFPNGQRGHDRVEFKLEFYALLLEQIDAFHRAGESVIITGDFNTAHNEIDLANPKENANTSGFLLEERAWIDRYLEHDLVDVYRTLYPEKVEYTWWTYRFGARGRNVGWRLDYYLVSKSFVPHIRDVVIHGDVQGSDHCPVTLELEDL
ncbi:MAG: exodeoxyribonuclease III [Anaerolineaceae bacterium]